MWREFQNTTTSPAMLVLDGSGIDPSEILETLVCASPRTVAWGIGRRSIMTSIEREREDINGDQLCPMKGILVRPAATPWVPSSGRREHASGWTADAVAPNISTMVLAMVDKGG